MRKFKVFLLVILACHLFSPFEMQAVCQVYFSPRDRLGERLIENIASEKCSIKAAVYCLMDVQIAKAFIDAYARGVDVEVIVDPYSLRAHSPIDQMVESGVDVYVWYPDAAKSSKKYRPLMHDKFCVFGKHAVWTGSFNFTKKASSSNRENAVLLTDKEIVNKFLEEFEALKRQGALTYQDYLEQAPFKKRA